MNDKLKNYSTQPDPEVWKKIQKTLRRQELRKQIIGGSIGTVIAVAAIVTVVLWPYDTKPTVTETAMPQVAQVAETPAQNSPAIEDLTAETAQVQAQQQPAMTPVSPKQVVQVEENTLNTAVQATTTGKSVPTIVSQPKISPVEESRPAETPRPAIVTRPSTNTMVATPKVEPEPVELESTVAESNPATPAVKNPIGSGVIEDTILWVPNAFAPASDNPDVTTFRARLNKADASILNYRLTIFNRQGHLVFQSYDINHAWDGSYKGRALPQGGYVYVIYYVDKDGLTHQRKGTVALIR